MTNPDNIIRLHSRAGGRGSVYEANAPYQVYSTGMFSGTGTSPNTSPDMNIIVGGGDKPASPTNPHIVVGENPQGYKVMLDIVGTTILQATAPATNKRYTAVVVYANDLSESSTDATTTGSPSQNGVILVNGPAAASPRMPNDSEIRAAITDDGGTGTQAVYAIIAAPVISSTTTTITDTNRQHSYLNTDSLNYGVNCGYDNYQGIATDTFKAPSDGFVTVHGSVASDRYDSFCVAQIEGRNCFYLHNAIQGLPGYNLQSAGQFYVSKGQTVTFKTVNGAGWIQRAFMPLTRI